MRYVLALLFVVGCGDDTVATPDAPSIDAPHPDARIDAPAIDAPAIDAPDIDAPEPDAAMPDARAPACNDNMRNGDETDVDCGGSCPARCQTGQHCLTMNDCTSQVCDANMTCAAPACNDGVQNGDETDIDCGGPSCGGLNQLCATGQHCLVAMDCASFVCDLNLHTCSAPACNDGVQNGDETDTDCGGPSCDGLNDLCANGKRCLMGMDCISGNCNSLHVCQ